MRQSFPLTAVALLLVLAATTVEAREKPCPAGTLGASCSTCVTDAACVGLTKKDTAWCFNTTVYTAETTKKSYACDTAGTPFADSISDVWAECNTEVQKCDVHFALGGNALTCSGLSCQFDGNSVFCGYTKCECDGTCPIVNGVSLGYMLEKLTGKTALECEESWAGPSLCTIDIQGLSAQEGGFQAYCAAAECRLW